MSPRYRIGSGVGTEAQLETDPELLIPKARAALARYGHQIVIGNDLHRRKYEVVFVEHRSGQRGPANVNASNTSSSDDTGADTPPLESTATDKLAGSSSTGEAVPNDSEGEFKETWLRLSDIGKGGVKQGGGNGFGGEIEIESLIIAELVKRHTDWIEAGPG